MDADEPMVRIGGGVTLLYVRRAQEYAAGHLPGALDTPVEELQERLPGKGLERQSALMVAPPRGKLRGGLHSSVGGTPWIP